MTRAEIDILWQRAMQQAVKDGEMFTRYHFAALVGKTEREACARLAEDYCGAWDDNGQALVSAIRARGAA